MKNHLQKSIRTMGLILVISFLSPISTKAQGMPVYDNTNFISLAKQLIESAKQTSNLLKTQRFSWRAVATSIWSMPAP